MSRCRSCDADIVWVTLPSGKHCPLDPQPVPGGNVVLVGPRDAGGEQQARTLSRDELSGDGWQGARYVTHFKTCPNAAEHRK